MFPVIRALFKQLHFPLTNVINRNVILQCSAKEYSPVTQLLVSQVYLHNPPITRNYSYTRKFWPSSLKNRESLHDGNLPMSVPYADDDDLLLPDRSSDGDAEPPLPSEKEKYRNDRLWIKISKCKMPSEVLKLYSKHHDIMTEQHLLKCLQQFNDMVIEGVLEGYELHDLNEFKDFCHQLLSSSRRMDTDDLLILLKCALRLEIPVSSKFMQSALQLIRHCINDFNLRQMIFLEFLLKKMPSTNQTDGLLFAIPVIIEHFVKKKYLLQDLTFQQLKNVFSLCVKNQVRNTRLVMEEIYNRKCIESGYMAMGVLNSLVDIHFAEGIQDTFSPEDCLTREVLIKECMEVISQNLRSLTSAQIEIMLKKISLLYVNGDTCCYNESFLHAVAKYTIEEQRVFYRIAYVMSYLLRMNFVSENLAKHLVIQAVKHPDIVAEAKYPILHCLTVISACQIRDENLQKALDAMMSHRNMKIGMEAIHMQPWHRIALDLLNVGYYPQELVEKLTDEEFLAEFTPRRIRSGFEKRQLLRLHQVLTMVENSNCKVPDRFIEDGKNENLNTPPSRSNLRALLSQILDEPNHLVSGVITEDSAYIGHLLVVDENGHTVKVVPDDLDVEGNIDVSCLQIPYSCRRIAVIDLGSSCAYGPSHHLKGYIQIDRKILEAEGYTVVHVLTSVVHRLTNDEKPLYIKERLMNAGVHFAYSNIDII